MSDQVVDEQALFTSATILQLSGEAADQRRATRLLADLRAGEYLRDLYFPMIGGGSSDIMRLIVGRQLSL